MVYESASNQHLRNLHAALAARAWRPSHATRLYLPKPSGLQRPLSLLGIEDQIVLQAVANIFAKHLRNKRGRVELQSVFSNNLATSNDSIFFMEHWQTTYRAFQQRCEEVFSRGYKWAAHFDLAAYYDTISHELLISVVSRAGRASLATDSIKDWLHVWSASDRIAMKAHGIPQGPIASDFLAEAFFLPIDLQLQSASFRYLRYVDDIRLFGRTEFEVRQAAIRLEQVCRHRGLIPQSSKFEIRELNSAQDAMGALPSIAPAVGSDSASDAMTPEEARKHLKSAIGGRPLKVNDKSRFRYVMYRAPKDSRVLGVALKILPRYPEHIDAIAAYFSNYGKSRRIVNVALTLLRRGLPYSYVRGELWHMVARLANRRQLMGAIRLARDDARQRRRCIALSWGVMHVLIRSEREGIIRLGRRLATEHHISRSLLAPMFPDREFTPGGHGATLVRGELIEQLAGARELQRRGLSLTALGLRQRDVVPSCKLALLSLGVIARRHSKSERDWISEILISLYGCSPGSWRVLFGTEYEHALQILIETRARFQGARNEWLALQDSFNDAMIRRYFAFLVSKGLNGHTATADRNGKLIKYGNLIANGGPFDRAYPVISDALRQIHYRRNALPGSHPYDERGGAQNRWLTNRERNSLKIHAKVALDGVAAVIEQHK